MAKDTSRPSVGLIESASRALVANQLVALAALGYLLALFPFNWCLHATVGQSGFTGPLNANLVIDIGEVAGYGVAIAWGLKRGQLPSGRTAAILFALLGLGSIVITLASQSSTALAAWAGDLALGAGYAAVFSFWLALISRFSPKKMLIILAVGYLANLIDYPVITDVSREVGCFYAIMTAATSLLIYALVHHRLINSAQSPLFLEETARPYWPPLRLAAFCTVISLAYGFCTGSIGVGVSTVGLKIGFALPAIIILVGLLASYRSFSLSSVYWISCPFMILGLLSTFFLDVNAMLVKILVTTALSGAHFVAYLVVRVRGQELKRDPLFAYAALSLLMMALTVAGKTMEPAFAGSTAESVAIVALVLGVVLTYGLLISKAGDTRAVDVRSALSPESVRDRTLKLAQTNGLSERETSVYQLLIEDKSVTDIANDLFIAPSTVRAHVSRIYSKFGVHSRHELQQKIEE
ncbi:helix-turn-helix transcriptional regulator [Adlercreutzia shanghongiae]|uniref:LuxR C-terminal-related transcriptional regulator n=1 Tax=Adlercreutzia shanghongiae TaxID=3111773 RepID=A0ABU6J1Y8_9ACTN|nr:LuxR C-terminal-related transcriptional regulator [Adlercreutzia sp. R22]MEC4295822.1 LuxR C-terminal-related transcriptional regulator [Adlercreutzia sp. R22]